MLNKDEVSKQLFEFRIADSASAHPVGGKLWQAVEDTVDFAKARFARLAGALSHTPDEFASTEPFMWLKLYNAALLESDLTESAAKVRRALKAIDRRKGTLADGQIGTPEWNLLLYAGIVLRRIARNCPLSPRTKRAASGRTRPSAKAPGKL